MRSAVVVVALALTGVAACAGDPTPPPPPATLSSIHDDIFSVSCSASVCHGGAGPADGLDLVGHPFETLVNVDSVDNPGQKRVIPGDPEHSMLFLVLQAPTGPIGNGACGPFGPVDGTHCSLRMPSGGDQLPAADLDRIKRWIAGGAKND